MKLPVFRIEEYLSQYEFSAPYLFCCSDPESWSLREILSLADEECIKLWDNLRLGYTEVAGLPQLREEIATLYDLSAEDVITFSGAEDAIYCTLNALVEKGDHVITYAPCYQSLDEIPRALGAEITQLVLSQDNRWKIDLDELERAFRPNTKLLVINFPHNPTGSTLDEESAQAIVGMARARGTFIFSDEVYRLLGPTGTVWVSPIATLYERGISLGVTSKAFGLAGLRIGWIACRNRSILKACERFRHYTSICSSAPSEVLALIALRSIDTILGRNSQIIDGNLSLLNAFFERSKGRFSWVHPEGGCVGFVKYDSAHSVDDLAHGLVEATGVLIMPARIYDFPGNYFRVGFGRMNMPEALERFETYVRGLQEASL